MSFVCTLRYHYIDGDYYPVSIVQDPEPEEDPAYVYVDNEYFQYRNWYHQPLVPIVEYTSGENECEYDDILEDEYWCEGCGNMAMPGTDICSLCAYEFDRCSSAPSTPVLLAPPCSPNTHPFYSSQPLV